eukprot:2881100-Lingulodinium_polyedra.AAC.1
MGAENLRRLEDLRALLIFGRLLRKLQGHSPLALEALACLSCRKNSHVIFPSTTYAWPHSSSAQKTHACCR